MHEWWLHSLQLSWFCWGSCSKRLSCVQLPQGERSLSQFLISFVCSFFMVFYLYLASFTPSSCHVSLYLEYVKPTRTSHLISIEHSTKTCHWYRFVQLSKKDGPTFQLDSSMYQQASYLKWFPIMPEVPKSQRMKLWSNSEIAKKTWNPIDWKPIKYPIITGNVPMIPIQMIPHYPHLFPDVFQGHVTFFVPAGGLKLLMSSRWTEGACSSVHQFIKHQPKPNGKGPISRWHRWRKKLENINPQVMKLNLLTWTSWRSFTYGMSWAWKHTNRTRRVSHPSKKG